jgi:hypothetical protein
MSCNQTGCEQPAAVEYVWPTDGQRKRSCAEHGDKARAVVGALGFGLELRPLMCAKCLEEIASFTASAGQPVSSPGDFCFMCGDVVAAAP